LTWALLRRLRVRSVRVDTTPGAVWDQEPRG